MEKNSEFINNMAEEILSSIGEVSTAIEDVARSAQTQSDLAQKLNEI